MAPFTSALAAPAANRMGDGAAQEAAIAGAWANIKPHTATKALIKALGRIGRTALFRLPYVLTAPVSMWYRSGANDARWW
jgi:hypothetical protein